MAVTAMERVKAAGVFVADTRSTIMPVRLPSGRVLVEFEPSVDEHERRVSLGVARGVPLDELHDLWELPGGLQVPKGALAPSTAARLMSMAGFVTHCETWVRRDFEPAGTVLAIAAIGNDAHALLRRVSALSPVMQRTAILTRSIDGEVLDEVREAATSLGIGLVVAQRNADLNLVVEAGPAERGVPHVFRWWMSELGYASWLSTAAPTS